LRDKIRPRGGRTTPISSVTIYNTTNKEIIMSILQYAAVAALGIILGAIPFLPSIAQIERMLGF